MSKKVVDLGFKSSVPANSSLYFRTQKEALGQLKASINLVYDLQDSYIRNCEYDAKLIQYDAHYCTTVSNLIYQEVTPTALYFFNNIMQFINNDSTIIEIGCGQGEFVNFLRSKGLKVKGYDPVLRQENKYLIKKFWDGTEIPADLFILRCVLPHIEDPWNFLDEIATNSPGTAVLIEFQNISWAIENALFYQISHDHVNLFQLEDFQSKYNILSTGSFSNGEWSWVLINPERLPTPTQDTKNISLNKKPFVMKHSKIDSYKNDFSELLNFKKKIIENIENSNISAIWGAAGKGIVLAESLYVAGLDLVVIDADQNRQSLYLEGSGYRCISPLDAFNRFSHKDSILVANPNHRNEIKNFTKDRFKLFVSLDLI